MISTAYRRRAHALLLALCAACEPGAAAESDRRGGHGTAAQVTAAGADTGISEGTQRALHAFRTTVRGPLPDRLTGAAPSVDMLIARFVDAVERADTAALIAMTMTRGEFVALHYPHSIYARPPYELWPADVWLLSRAETEKGLTRLLRRFGGKPFGFVRYRCTSPPRREGPNRWYAGCTITRSADGQTHTMRYFASIWERDGRFKFGGYGNDL